VRWRRARARIEAQLELLTAEYRELQELRERVKNAEAAAALRLKSRSEGKSSSASNGGVRHNSQPPHRKPAPLWNAAVVGQKPGKAHRLR
jgi:hypothetical protein